ncbi:MAG: nuclear transport factor 2 family protein [Ignavibacteria bacterium]|nr:nuclear transport factor 2 family protein [Ignavibacteria bacterium]
MNETMNQLFTAIDTMNAEEFASHLTDDVEFRFGNAPSVFGKSATQMAVEGFFGSIKGLRHEVAAVDQADETIYSYGFVTYTRHEGSTLRVPFCNVFGMKGNLIKDYLIFADLSELYR